MRSALVIVCFFASGVAALILEICWIRRASLVFGSTTAALSTVLAVFFAGLALGSLIFGRASQRTRQPLRLYAVIEIALAIAALLTLPALDLVDSAYGAAYRAFDQQHPAALSMVRVALTAIVLLPPTILMGGTLPLLCAHFVVPGARIAGRVGFLYGINTLGAACGCAIAGMILIPTIGVFASVLLAALLDAAIGLAVLLMRPPVAAAPAPRAPEGEVRDRAVVAALFFGTGFVALGIEVVWTRHLALLVVNTIHTYTITLTVVLIGIVLGSWLAALLFDRRLPRAFSFAFLQVLMAWAIVIVLRLPPEVWRGFESQVAVAFLLLLPGAVLSGACFPLAVRMVLDDPARAGIRVGAMTAVNTLGGIAGALSVGFLGLPLLGLDRSARILSGVSLVIAICALLLALRSSRSRRVIIGAATAALAAVALWALIPLTLRTRVPADFLADPDSLVDYEEGKVSNLAVVRAGSVLQLEIDRWWQGEDRRNHQAMTAHIPALLHPGARRVLVVGAGTGQTPARFLMHPVEQLDCVDIEPALYEFVREHFDSGWMMDERVRLLAEDGRNYIAHTDAHYDVISLEVGQLFRPGIAAFYTVDFYEQALQRLEPGGMLTQLVPLPFLDEEIFRRVLATFIEVFPQSMLWYNTSELLLVGMNTDRISISWEDLEKRIAVDEVHRDLDYSYWGGEEHRVHTVGNFLAGFLCGPRALAALAQDRPVLTDNRPVLEYATRLADPHQRREIPLVTLLQAQLEPIDSILSEPLDPRAAASVHSLRTLNVRDMKAHANLRVAEMLGDRIGPGNVIALLEEALRWNPSNFACHRQMAATCAAAGRLEQARQSFENALALRPDDAASNRGLGYVLIQLGRSGEAIGHLERSLAALPEDAIAHNYLGVALGQTGDLSSALAHFRTAARLAPSDESIRANLAQTERALSSSP